MATAAEKSERAEFRMAPEQKALMERAAALAGETLSGFGVSAILEKARQVIAQHETISVSDRDRDLLLALLDAPPGPSEKLMQAKQRYLTEVERVSG